jgi:hypothetical protein
MPLKFMTSALDDMVDDAPPEPPAPPQPIRPYRPRVNLISHMADVRHMKENHLSTNEKDFKQVISSVKSLWHH